MSQSVERTLAIIKPDAVAKKATGPIIAEIEKAGFEILGMKQIRLSEAAAQAFYDVHKEKPFYAGLVAFMTSGPVVVLALQRENAIRHWRAVMGATNPENAEAGTIRKLFGTNVERNASHGSDAPETARREVSFFFSDSELDGLFTP